MIEDRLANEFRTAVAGEPPLGFDPDDVVTEAIRRRKRRQAAGATALGTGGVALAAVAVFATSAGTGGVSVGASPSGSSAAQTATTPPGSDDKNAPVPTEPPASFPGSDDAITQLGPVIPAVLHDRVPGLAFDKPDSGTLMVVDDPHGVGGAYLAAGTKHRYVTVFVYHDRNALDLAGDPAADGGWGVLVSDTTQQDGSHVRVYSHDGGDSQGLAVLHLRTDGVIVQADTTAKPEDGQTGLATSQEVLTAVATDPRLTF